MITTHAKEITRGRNKGFYKGFVKVTEETENHGVVGLWTESSPVTDLTKEGALESAQDLKRDILMQNGMV